MAIAFPSVLSAIRFCHPKFSISKLPLKKREKATKNNSLRALETHYFRGTTTPERRDDDDDSEDSDPLVVVVFIFFAEEEEEKEERETATTTTEQQQFVSRNGNIRLE